MADPSSHPYRALPDHCFWHKAMGSVPPFAVDPVVTVPFQISSTTKVATAGSCFAQHIARALQKNQCSYYVVETAPESLPAAEHADWNYGTFSARFGNLYTTRQLLQLFQRAYGTYRPELPIWQTKSGAFVDPFRPRIQPNGFGSAEELLASREVHLAAVRRMFETLDVFVFTLGLTESWEHIADGAVLPLAPGVAGGVWERDKYRFVNYSAAQVETDLLEFIDGLRRVNPASRIILTVSPVPLVATYENRHVLVSTCLSKSVLRVAAHTCSSTRDAVLYFPSYEIITGPHAGGQYYDDDLRSVTETGVSHVMRTFFRHLVADDRKEAPRAEEAASYAVSELQALKNVICDEESLAR